MRGLYKAKSKKTVEWVEGCYCYILNPKTKNGEPIKHLICNGTNIFNTEIDPETLCQYIGKDDKNGKKIWEHDIISINTYDYTEPAEDYFGEVVYCEAWACWCIKQPGEEKPIPLCECEGSYLTERVVEGNTFDNPDMVEGEE